MRPLLYHIFEKMELKDQINFMVDYFQKIKKKPATADPRLMDQFVDMTFSNNETFQGLHDFLKNKKFSTKQVDSVVASIQANGYREDAVKFLTSTLSDSPKEKLWFSTLCDKSNGNLVDMISSKFDISPEFVIQICQNTTGQSTTIGKGEMALAIFCTDAEFDTKNAKNKADIRKTGPRTKGIEVKAGVWQPKGQKTDFAPSVEKTTEFIQRWQAGFGILKSDPPKTGGIDLLEIISSKHPTQPDIKKALIDLMPVILPTAENQKIEFEIRKREYKTGKDINKAIAATAILCYHASEKFDGIFMLADSSAGDSRTAYDYMYIKDFSPSYIFDLIFNVEDDGAVTNINLSNAQTCIPKINSNNYLNSKRT